MHLWRHVFCTQGGYNHNDLVKEQDCQGIVTRIRVGRRQKVAVAMCPSCDARIRISGDPDIGMRVTCPECGDLLEVVELNPIELDWVYYDDGGGDWEDDGY